MMQPPAKLDAAVRKAVRHFWRTRKTQARLQGSSTGNRDTGARAAVTGGAQLRGFTELIGRSLEAVGVSEAYIFHQKTMELPGWYRAEKKWDLLVVAEGQLVAGVELKSQVGPSFGNNFNNRAEEAIGNASDLWAAYREGAFEPSMRPWLGYLMILEEASGSTKPVTVSQPHFEVFPEFKTASYARRYEVLLTKLVRERLYDSACFLLSSASDGSKGTYSEPAAELTFRKFLSSLLARVTAMKLDR